VITSHHVFPAPPGPETGGAQTLGVFNGSGASFNLTATTAPPLEAGYAVGYLPLLAFIALLVILSLLLLASRGEQPPLSKARGRGGPGLPSPSYRYQGVRARLRSAFLMLRGAAEDALGSTLRHAAPGELARMIGGPALGFAEKYSRAMYGRRLPSTDEAAGIEEEARRVSEWLSRSREG